MCVFKFKWRFPFIGIRNNKTIEGLDFDFNLASDKDYSTDYFQLEFKKLKEKFIGLSIILGFNFYKIEEKTICCIEVLQNKRRLVFLKTKEGTELYIRGEAYTHQLKDPEKIINYWRDKGFD